MLAVGHVDIADDVNDATIGLFWETFVLAAVAGFHVEDWDVEALGTDNTEATVGVAKHKHCIGLGLHEELVGAIDDVATGSAKVITYCIHIHFWSLKLQVLEEDAIEVVVVVLTSMGQNDVEVLAALVNHCCKTDNLGTCADDDDKLQFAIVLEAHIAVIVFWLLFHISKFISFHSKIYRR